MIQNNQWQHIKLKYIASINDDTLSEDTDPNLEINYIDIGNVTSEGTIIEIVKYLFSDAPSRARRIVKVGDIIVSTVRTYLQAIAYIDFDHENLIASTGFAVVTPKDNILFNRFCKYALRSENFLVEVEKRSVGVSYPAINASDIGDISITIPTYSGQKIIANFLDKETERIDTLIKAKESLLVLLAEKKQALITRAVTKGINPNARMKGSCIDWLGEIPEHWEVIQLKFLSNEPLKYGANEAALDDNPENPRFIRITDIDEDGKLKNETFKSLEPEVAEPFLLKEGDILMARSGATVGKAFMYETSWGIACFAGYLIRLRANTEKLLPRFLILITQSEYYWSQIYTESIQATIANFSGEKYASMKIILPTTVEQQQIISFITKESERINNLKNLTQKSIDLLKERRAALIAAAVTGQIDVN